MMLPAMMRPVQLMVLLWCLPLLRATTDGSNDQHQSSEARTCAWSETTQRDECRGADSGSNDNDHDDAVRKARRPPEQCRIVLAPSELGGYGVFPLTKLRRGQAVLSGDLVIHLVDYPHEDRISKSSSTIMADDNDDYWRRWSTDDTGGMYEGKDAHRILVHAPGIGMVANGDSGFGNSATNPTTGHLLPGVPRVDEGGLTRAEYPGTGAITHYHNWTFYVRAAEIAPGEELLVQLYQQHNRGGGRRDDDASRTTRSATTSSSSSSRRSVDWLRENGWCLDNVRPIPVSKYQHAGRGLVARRPLAAGAVVAPVPVRAIRRSSLRIGRRQRRRADGKKTTLDDEETEQLLINYCFGHPDSSILLYSYGPMVNLINHAGGKLANVKLRWVETPDPTNQPDPLSRSYLMELVATQPLAKGDEILLDYGSYWVEAWMHHLQRWQPVPGADTYTPSYVMDDAVKVLRTEKELLVAPYPDNVFTSCYYRYSDHQVEAERLLRLDAHSVTAFGWTLTRGLFQPRNLRPCTVVDRVETATKLEFTVQILNRPGLPSTETIPKGHVHLVSHVPRNAIVFSDRPYTTDPHLHNPFRHPIGLPGNLFPEAWKDLKQQRDG